MAVSLAQISANTPGGQSRKGFRVLAPIRPATTSISGLAAIYVGVLREIQQAARDILLPIYEATASVRDDKVSPLQGAQITFEDRIRQLLLAAAPQIRQWTLRVEASHRARMLAAIESTLSVDLSTILMINGVSEELSVAYQRNLSLITSVSEQVRDRIAQAVWSGYSQRLSRRQISRQVDDATGLGRERSLRIAQDQAAKLSSTLDQARQTELGITHYVWRHSHKFHPRPVHVARDGKLFSWDNPPAGGHPGTEPYCGCKAQGYVNFDDPAVSRPNGPLGI